MPNTLVNMQVKKSHIDVSIKVPLIDFQIAFADSVSDKTADKLKAYFQNHIKAFSTDKRAWQQNYIGYELAEMTDANVGKYIELTVNLTLTPPDAADLRTFDLYYDAVMHQIVTHQALIYVQQDWENGINGESVQAGIVGLDIPTRTIPPLSIALEKGSILKGFKSMVTLGMNHIAEGTDHLLFLLTLLLPAPLLVSNRKWAQYGGLKHSLLKLIKIITAFTIGHSLTLILGTLGWIPFSSRVIEIAIAVSILISAMHALKPLFYKKEIYIAAGFGLIHGLAFSDTLTPLHLDSVQMGLSILGFNIGIELMQLAIMAMILPSLLLLSQTPFYKPFRVMGAIEASIAAIGWVFERTLNVPNIITQSIEEMLPYAIWGIGFLMIFAIMSYYFFKKRVFSS